MVSSSYKILNSIGAYFPCALLFGIMAFIYFSFTFTYVFPLLNDSYNYDKNDNKTQDIYVFAQMLNTEQKFFSFFKFQDMQWNEHHNKGLIIFCFLHFFLFWFLCSVLRTIFTNPGSVPSEWNKELEEKLHIDFEKEQKILKQVRMDAKKQQKKIEKASKIADKRKELEGERASLIERTENLFKITEEEDRNLSESKRHEEIKEKEEREKLLQGRQGTNSDTSEVTPYGDSENFSVEDDQEEELDPDVLRKMNQIVLLTIVERENKRFCSHCQKFKPLRTHHCKQCSRCILKMDHHCQWVLNCIGFYNYKYFMNMLIYANLTLIFIIITNSKCVQDTALNPEVSFSLLFIIMLNHTFSIVLYLILMAFCTFHFCLIFSGKSTIEYCENKKDGRSGKYDFGAIKNFVSVFGRNPLLWFLPISPNTKSEGVKFEAADL